MKVISYGKDKSTAEIIVPREGLYPITRHVVLEGDGQYHYRLEIEGREVVHESYRLGG